MEYLAAALVIISLFVYSVLFSIECGATLFIAEPELLGDGGEKAVHGYVNPAWETTNVFLITAFISLIAFFPGAFPLWSKALIVPLLIFLIVMGLRVIGMLSIFYTETKSRAMRAFLFFASFTAPVVLAGGVLPFFFAGGIASGPSESASWWLLASVFATIAFATTIFIASSFFAFLKLKKSSHPTPRFVLLLRFSLIFFIVAAAALVFVFQKTIPQIIPGMSPYLVGFSLLALIDLLLLFASHKKYFGVRFALALALFATLFFGAMIAHLPYVIYPSATIFSAFTDAGSAVAMLTALGIALVFLVPALGLLYYLIATKK